MVNIEIAVQVCDAMMPHRYSKDDYIKNPHCFAKRIYNKIEMYYCPCAKL